MANDDKYPVESDRRRFVKGVVGGAALSGALTTGAVSISLATTPAGGGGGPMSYRGAIREAGPAPRGLPQIPVEIDDDGLIRGVWPEPETIEEGGVEYQVSRTDIAGVEYSTEWFQYCGLQTFEGIRPDADQDEYFRYVEAPPTGDYPWMEEIEPGAEMQVDDFADYEDWVNDIGDPVGKPATGTWRSEGLPPEQTIPVVVIRSQRIEEIIAGEHELADQYSDDEIEWLEATCPQGIIAFVNKCTHFCCVPGFKRAGESPEYNAENKIYCQCHQSVYDPFNVEEQRFVSLPRPEDDE